MDVLSKKQRRKAMQGNKSKDTSIEIILRKALWAKGFRFRINYDKLPGKPDIALVKDRIAIFCDSEFWHGYKWREKKKKLDTNKEFWIKKIEGNIKRDRKVNNKLRKLKWKVLRFWGEEINNKTANCVQIVQNVLGC